MTRHPFDSSEVGLNDDVLDRIGERLEEYANEAGAGEPPDDLAARIRATIDSEPAPSASWRHRVAAILVPWRGPARLFAAAVVVVAAVTGALAVGQLADLARDGTGSTPSPVEHATPSPTPTVTPTPTVSPSPTPSPSPSPSPTATPPPTDEPMPTATDDDGDEAGETPSPTHTEGSSGSGSDD